MEQKINCNVHNCKHCDCDCNCCNLKEIKICNCNKNIQDKKNTICDSYKDR